MKKTMLLCALALLLTGCGKDITDLYTKESETTSGSVGPYVETSNIHLEASSHYNDKLAGSVVIDVHRGDTLERLRVGTGDSLLVTLDGTSLPVEEERGISCQGRIGPCTYSYYYRAFFQQNPGGQTLTIALERESGVSSLSTADFPSYPAIITPAPGANFNLSTDAINVSWQPGVAGDHTELVAEGDCVMYEDYWVTDPDNTHILPQGTHLFNTHNDECAAATEYQMQLSTARYRDYPADPALAPSSVLRFIVEDEVLVWMNP